MSGVNFNKVIIILLVSTGLAIAYNLFSSKGVPLFGFSIRKYISAELLRSTTDSSPINEPKHISLKEALKLHQAKVTFIDARENEEYQKGHITNSLNIPYLEFDKYKVKLNNIPKDEPLVSYCGGTDCDLSIMLGNKLASLGYSNVFIFFGGWNSWTEANYPISK